MKIREGFMLREVDSTSIVVAIGEESVKFNGMIRLNETGTFLWKLIKEETGEDEILFKMLETYDVDEATARNGIKTFISKLRENGLLVDE